MQIIAGREVTNENFYRGRLPLVESLREMLRGNDVLIIGPRRTGKTSIIKEFIRQEKEKKGEDVGALYLNLEDCRHLYDFYIRLCLAVEENENAILGEQGRKILGGIKKALCEIFSITSSAELKLGSISGKFPEIKEKVIDYFESEFKKVLLDVSKETYIVLDEFPEMIWWFGTENTKLTKDEIEALKKRHTQILMAGLRRLRHEEENKKYKFIIAGSVNLVTTLEGMNLEKCLNDLDRLHIPHLTEEQAVELFSELARSAAFAFSEDADFDGFIKKYFGKCAPYYIQIFAETLQQSFIETGSLQFTREILIKSFYRLLLHKDKKGPIELRQRLSRFYLQDGGMEKFYAETILKIISRTKILDAKSLNESDLNKELNAIIGKELSRPYFTELLQKMCCDGLIETGNNSVYIDSNLLVYFWYYSFVSSDLGIS